MGKENDEEKLNIELTHGFTKEDRTNKVRGALFDQMIQPIGSFNYNEFQIPPDKTLLDNYVKATNFGCSVHAIKEAGNRANTKVCPISGLPLENKPYSMCDSPSDYIHNGIAYVLFFKVLKYVIIGVLFLLPLALYYMKLYGGGRFCSGDTTEPLAETSASSSRFT